MIELALTSDTIASPDTPKPANLHPVSGLHLFPEASMIQIMGQYGDIIFAATCSDTWTPDLADDMANQVRRALVTANAQLLDAEHIDG